MLALGFMGNMVQANSIGAAFTEAFGAFNITISPVVIGVIVAAVAAFVFLGGTQRLLLLRRLYLSWQACILWEV